MKTRPKYGPRSRSEALRRPCPLCRAERWVQCSAVVGNRWRSIGDALAHPHLVRLRATTR